MHIVILCATERGYRFTDHMINIGKGYRFTVFSFRETAWEPPYLDNIKRMVEGHGHTFNETRNVGHPKWERIWRDGVDLLLMVNWRYLVTEAVYSRARKGAYVLHDSLLPAYRGFSPTVWAMINGESETGATLFRAAEDYDAGDIVDQRRVPIGAKDTIADVVEQVTRAYVRIIDDNLENLLAGKANAQPQDHSKATYTCKWTPHDALINWHSSSQSIYNLVRASSKPYPGAFTYLNGRKLTVWSAKLSEDRRSFVASVPGRIVCVESGEGATVLTGDGLILLQDVEFEGEGIVNATKVLASLSMTLAGGRG